jgi:membrane associated rhomboid family serine protease
MSAFNKRLKTRYLMSFALVILFLFLVGTALIFINTVFAPVIWLAAFGCLVSAFLSYLLRKQRPFLRDRLINAFESRSRTIEHFWD